MSDNGGNTYNTSHMLVVFVDFACFKVQRIDVLRSGYTLQGLAGSEKKRDCDLNVRRVKLSWK